MHRLSFHAALFAALVFLWPSQTQAMRVPESVTLQSDSFAQVLKPEEIKSWYSFARAFGLREDRFQEIESTETPCKTQPFFCAGFLSRATHSHIVLTHDVSLLPEAVTGAIASFADQANQDPINAQLSVTDGKIVIAKEAENGILVDQEKSRVILEQALAQNTDPSLIVTLISEIAPAKVSSSTLATLGITELVGTATTDFTGSPKNRVYNIERSIQQYDGIVLEKGAIFSFVEYLGEVDGEHGYLPELVIKNNKTEPEFGGGVCQVSTTVFRAALQAGLKITERRNHAYAVSYYKPYGMDATIYIPKPDLQFQNNTPGALLFIPEVNGMKLTFSIFGTSDGRATTIDGPHILESNPDGSMKTVFTQTVKDSTGTAFINDSFWSNYKSPSLFPHPGDEPTYTSKPKGWSEKQWREYKAIQP